MVNNIHLRLNASERSYFAILKREVAILAASASFPQKRLAEVDIVVAEMVSNLVKHANGGEVLVKLIEEKGVQGIEIICIDNGPGISDVRNMMKDGVSSTNTLGNGLGAIQRLSNFFQIYTQKGWGTILLSRIFAKELPVTQLGNLIEIRSLVIPKPGETESGDNFSFKQTNEYIKLFLGDGLGHGKDAAVAVNTAIEAFSLCESDSPVENIRFIHNSVKKTRGLVGTIAIFSIKNKQWKICGVGNISTRMFSSVTDKTLTSYNGIIGLNMPKTMNDHLIEYVPGQLMLMCSDGIKSKWDLLKLPSIIRSDLSLLNAALFKDFTRNTDDSSIVSCKINL